MKYTQVFIRSILLFSFLFIHSGNLLAQDQFNTIIINGKVVDYLSNVPPERIMVVNKKSYTGILVGADGKFTISIYNKDTLLITALGYEVKQVCYKDSVFKPAYNSTIKLYPKTYYGNEIVIKPVKPIGEVEKEIGSISSKYKPTYNKIESDNVITLLYMRFSKYERSKQLVAQLEANDAMRDALKDLFRIYIKNDIMYLSDNEFDSFIDFCSLDLDYVQSVSMYELAETIKFRYTLYKDIKKYKK